MNVPNGYLRKNAFVGTTTRRSHVKRTLMTRRAKKLKKKVKMSQSRKQENGTVCLQSRGDVAGWQLSSLRFRFPHFTTIVYVYVLRSLGSLRILSDPSLLFLDFFFPRCARLIPHPLKPLYTVFFYFTQLLLNSPSKLTLPYFLKVCKYIFI